MGAQHRAGVYPKEEEVRRRGRRERGRRREKEKEKGEGEGNVNIHTHTQTTSTCSTQGKFKTIESIDHLTEQQSNLHCPPGCSLLLGE